MPDLFKEIIPSILKTKNNVFETQEDYKSYVPFVINKAISSHMDCVFQANEMNIYSNLDKDIQYNYYINSIRSHNRPFQKWFKKEKLEDFDSVKNHYKMSNEKIESIMKLLTPEQITMIKEKQKTGGINDKSG